MHWEKMSVVYTAYTRCTRQCGGEYACEQFRGSVRHINRDERKRRVTEKNAGMKERERGRGREKKRVKRKEKKKERAIAGQRKGE